MSVRKYVLLSLCTILLVLPVAAGAAKSKVPPGSFLTRPVSSPAELSSLVLEDKVAALRYSKHYGMEPTALAEYFRENLTVSTLDRSGKYTIYFIAKNGRVVEKQKYLKAGVKVFVARNGQPILDVKCGNPLTKVLPREVVKVEPLQQVVPEPTPTVAEVLTSEPTPPVEVKVAEAAPIELTPAVTPSVSVAPEIGKVIPLLGIIGAIGALGGGGGGEPIPEPASILVLGTGTVGVLVWCYKGRRR